MRKLWILLFVIPCLALGQEKGIHFEKQSTWEQVKAKAKAENKHIFVDCFTTWCGPCKYMSSTIFPQEKVGTFFNDKFVNLKIQMDQTEKDEAAVKEWYSEAERFAKDYAIIAYPTFLIFNPDGELVHRIVGGGEADPFIAMAAEGLNPETQYITLVNKFKANPSDMKIAKAVAQKAENAYDKALAAEARTAFLDGSPESELLKKENIPFLIGSATSTDSKAYKIINNNKAKIDAEMGAGKANEALASVLLRTLVIPKAQAAEIADFDSLEKEIAANHPEVDMSDMLRQFKPQYYYQKQNWPKFKDAVNALILSTPNTVSANSLNSFAWAIFENCADVACIKAALDWSKTAVEKEENAAFYDTYANLLHKAGDQKNAVLWAEKALAIAEASDKETYQTVLEKIKAGSPTWE